MHTSIAKLGNVHGLLVDVILVSLLVSVGGCTAQSAQAPTVWHRGRVVSVIPIDTQSRADVSTYLAAAGIDGTRVRSGVRAYRVVYQTVTPNGEPTTASELVAFPDGRGERMKQTVWLHGTTLFRRGVASLDSTGVDRPLVHAIASTGHATSAPDYLGLGDSEETHPYNHPPSTTTASVDARHAMRSVASHQKLQLDPTVSVTGHSQSGSATPSVARSLSDSNTPLGVIAPLSGAFDIGRLVNESIDSRIPNASGYLSYLALTWNRIHRMYQQDSAMCRPPYDRTIPGLFNGEHPEDEVAPRLPEDPKRIFTRQTLSDIEARRGMWGRGITLTDEECSWHPHVPVTLYTARADADVPDWNAERCRRQFDDQGAQAKVIDVGNVDHQNMALRARPRVLRLIDALPPANAALATSSKIVISRDRLNAGHYQGASTCL